MTLACPPTGLAAHRPATDGDGTDMARKPCVVDSVAHVAGGRYTDRMRRCDDGRWRFEERRVSFFFWTPAHNGWSPGRYDWQPARAAGDHRTVERLRTPIPSSPPSQCETEQHPRAP